MAIQPAIRFAEQVFPIGRLPNEIRVNHGPRELLGRFFLEADRDAQDRGVTLYLSYDLNRLTEINERNRSTWAPLLPVFDPTLNNISPGSSFLIEGRNPAGDVVATQAARLFDWTGTTLKAELETLRFLYQDPERHARPGERITVTAPTAERITGLVAISGGVWFHPDYRRRGLSKVLPRISRAYAHTLWNTDWSFGLVDPSIVERNLVKAYGYRNSEPLVQIRNSRRDADAHLISFTAPEMLSELVEHTASNSSAVPSARAAASRKYTLLPNPARHAVGNNSDRRRDQRGSSDIGRRSLITEEPETNRSPPAVSHGNNRRS
jgi:hypothetical protein